MNQATTNAMDALRVAAQEYLSKTKLSASRIISVDVNSKSVRLLSFDYYGSSDKAQELIDVNKSINVPYYSGQIKVLTE